VNLLSAASAESAGNDILDGLGQRLVAASRRRSSDLPHTFRYRRLIVL